MPEESVVLKYKTHLPLPGMALRGLLTVEKKGAVVRGFKASDDPQQGSFTAARRP
jgi:hypothetical protein